LSTLTLERTGFAPAPGATGFFRRKNKEAGTTVDRENAAAARAFMEDAELPQWEKDFIDRRLEMAQRHPERLKPVAALLETL